MKTPWSKSKWRGLRHGEVRVGAYDESYFGEWKLRRRYVVAARLAPAMRPRAELRVAPSR